jgi:MoxR-like ATPase
VTTRPEAGAGPEASAGEASADRGAQPAPGPPQPGAEFADVDDVLARMAAHGYLADRRLATTVFLQTRLGKPVLLEGPAGVGKTQLALSLAETTGRRLLRLQCYEGQDETKALYEWDYGKQLLYTQILREKIGETIADAANLHEAVERVGAEESVFFSDRFLAPRPLLDAIRSPEPVVLLIDEVDRADEALEAVLLETLAENQISIPEVGTYRAKQVPYVILTSNNTRDLSAALKRRCLHLFIDYPDSDRELDIIRSKDTGLVDAVAHQLVQVVRKLREMELHKAPSISETIDWARTLAVLGVTELDAAVLADTASVVVKYERDLRRTLEVLPQLVDPNATVPDRLPGHSHRHTHGPGGHSHESQPPDAPARTGSADAGPDGRAIRRSKDQPGRHDEAYYGSPTATSRPEGARPRVGTGQGARSFAAGLGRRKSS